MHDALTDMHVYTMFLESQGGRVAGPEELSEELEAFRQTVVALQEQSTGG